MHQNLSVRTYTPVEQTHSHHFHQVVVPLQGSLEINLEGIRGVLTTSQGVVIEKNTRHSFSAKKDARFLVADVEDLPKSANFSTNPTATLSCAFKSFCSFADTQLQSRSDNDLERSMIDVFKRLLALQDFQSNIDRRISRALVEIESDISKEHRLAELASVSALSVSQFKLLFAQNMGMSATQYLLKLRMEKASVLLKETSMPITSVAEFSGYTDQSAFTRRFQKYFGESPSRYRR